MSLSYYGGKARTEAWRLLVHVCRRWRNLVFRSPRRLNLQLFCTPKTPAKDKLYIWPALPLIVRGDMTLSSTDNVIAALGHSNRVCKVDLGALADRQLEEVFAAMQVPFPELTDLHFHSKSETSPVIPDSFLNGSAPRLRYLYLDKIPFPGLPKLLLSATRLVELWLYDIPHSGYISPEVMVALLCALSSLEILCVEFPSPQSRPDWESRSLPPPKRSILPALDNFHFKGVIEYLEDLVTRIDAPQLSKMGVTFFNQIDLDCPRVVQFINRTLKLRKCDAHVKFQDWSTEVSLEARSGTLEIEILCRESDLQVSSVAEACSSSLLPLSTVKNLYLEHHYSQLDWENAAIESTLWLQLLRPFTAVKNLYLSWEFAPGITAALHELVGARIAEVLPSLQNIFVEWLEPWGPFQENIGQFAAARRHSGHPIAISLWDRDSD
jgi:hypothetical protein